MLLGSYTKEIFRAECNPGSEALHCFPTCMVFAVQVAEGAKGPEDCPPLDDANRKRLSSYLGRFRFDF